MGVFKTDHSLCPYLHPLTGKQWLHDWQTSLQSVQYVSGHFCASLHNMFYLQCNSYSASGSHSARDIVQVAVKVQQLQGKSTVTEQVPQLQCK